MKRGTQKETPEQSAAVPAGHLAGQAGWAWWGRAAVHRAALLKPVPLHTPRRCCCEQQWILSHRKRKRGRKKWTPLSNRDVSLLRQQPRATDSTLSTCVLEQGLRGSKRTADGGGNHVSRLDAQTAQA